jgi:hypothetical protein
MIQFDKPQNLNGTELLAELNAGKVSIIHAPVIDGNGDFWLDIDTKDKVKASSIVAAHNGTISAPDHSTARQAILDRLGITADEAALLLG